MLVVSIACVAQELQVAFGVGIIMSKWVPNLWDSVFILDRSFHLVSKNQRKERGLFGIGKHPRVETSIDLVKALNQMVLDSPLLLHFPSHVFPQA